MVIITYLCCQSSWALQFGDIYASVLLQVGILTKDNIVKKMLEGKDSCDTVDRIVKEILTQKIIEAEMDF